MTKFAPIGAIIVAAVCVITGFAVIDWQEHQDAQQVQQQEGKPFLSPELIDTMEGKRPFPQDTACQGDAVTTLLGLVPCDHP